MPSANGTTGKPVTLRCLWYLILAMPGAGLSSAMGIPRVFVSVQTRLQSLKPELFLSVSPWQLLQRLRSSFAGTWAMEALALERILQLQQPAHVQARGCSLHPARKGLFGNETCWLERCICLLGGVNTVAQTGITFL